MKRGSRSGHRNQIKIPKSLAISFLVVFSILIIGFFIGYYEIIFSFFGEDEFKIDSCGDGTLYGECALRKPYYCKNGFLIERASLCDCPGDLIKNGNSCISSYQVGPQLINLSYVFEGVKEFIQFQTYLGMAQYLGNISRAINYKDGEKPQRVDFKLRYIEEKEQHFLLSPLVVEIQNRANSKDDQARIAISLVQNIPFGKSEKKTYVGNGIALDYSRYPYEVLYDQEGVCGEKSVLLSYLLKEIGYGVVMFYFPGQNHEAVGIKCLGTYDFSDSGYCFVETSGPSILSDSGLEYVGGIKLGPDLEIMELSQGISLGSDLEEYSDAQIFWKARESGSIGSGEFKRIVNKYGLVDRYYLE